MAPRVEIDAPAKLNLHLDVMKARADGYHPIVSLFQTVSLADAITVRVTEAQGVVLDADCDCPMVENTMYRAARDVLEASDAGFGVSIRAEKRIPSAAGLGGGSSDAAAVLRAMEIILSRIPERIRPRPLPKGRIEELAAAIGSDVPYFLSGTAAIVTGRGEMVEPVRPRMDISFLLVVPPFRVSTREAYGILDASGRLTGNPIGTEELADRYARLDPSAWGFGNTFSGPLSDVHGALRDCVRAIERTGAGHAAMTGSGSVCFGVFSSIQAARSAAEALRGSGYDVREAMPLASLPELRYHQ